MDNSRILMIRNYILMLPLRQRSVAARTLVKQDNIEARHQTASPFLWDVKNQWNRRCAMKYKCQTKLYSVAVVSSHCCWRRLCVFCSGSGNDNAVDVQRAGTIANTHWQLEVCTRRPLRRWNIKCWPFVTFGFEAIVILRFYLTLITI